MTIRELIDELVAIEAETGPDEEVYAEVEVSPGQIWYGCLITDVRSEDDVTLKVLTP